MATRTAKLALPIFALSNLIIGWLALRSLLIGWRYVFTSAKAKPETEALP